MVRGRVCLPDAQSQHILAAQFGVRQVKITALVEVFQQALVDFVSTGMAEANQVKGCRCDDLEAWVGFDPAGKFLSHGYMAPDVMAQTFDAVVADDEPQL